MGRSKEEILFRLKQEAANLQMWLRPPVLRAAPEIRNLNWPDAGPVAAQWAGSSLADSIVSVAEQVSRGEYPLLGVTLRPGRELRWRRDYFLNRESELAYFRRVPYLDRERAGDHKIVWEWNRHAHWVILAQAWRLTGKAAFVECIERELQSWAAQNPFPLGMNWTSALEVAFRAFNWLWVLHIAGDGLSQECRMAMWANLYQHGHYLNWNLSVYFSPNTHLLGEAVVLAELGRAFGGRQGSLWHSKGSVMVAESMRKQVLGDGAYFEASTAYHVYAFDLFLWHALQNKTSEEYRASLLRMGDYLYALLGAGGRMPRMGDDDGGRFFHPYGDRERFGLESLATAAAAGLGREKWKGGSGEMSAWWLGAKQEDQPKQAWRAGQSEVFEKSGLVSIQAGENSIYFDAGGFGAFQAGHSHADSLSVLWMHQDRAVLEDPGTYTYVAEPEWRERFRAAAMHNTVTVEGKEQARPAGPFAWKGRPQVRLLGWRFEPGMDEAEAEVIYEGVKHVRKIRYSRAEEQLEVWDRIEGEGILKAELRWHLGDWTQGRDWDGLEVDGKKESAIEGGAWGWRSAAPGYKEPAPVVCISKQGVGLVEFYSRIRL